MGEDDRRRDERDAPAHDAHPQGRGSHSQQGGGDALWIGKVIVMAGVPSIMQAMLNEGASKLKIGVRMLSETARADARGGDIGMQLGETQANPAVAIGSYPFFDPQQHGPNTNVVLRVRDAQKLALAKRAVEDMLARVRRAQSRLWAHSRGPRAVASWSTSPFRRVRETHRERTAKVPTRPIRIRLHPIRHGCGSCQQRDLPSNAPALSWCRACVFHLQGPAERPSAPSSASQDATRRSPAAIWSSPQGDRRAPYERAPLRFRRA